MKGSVLYKSNYGSTKQYAAWLSEETGYPEKDINNIRKKDLQGCEVLIVGSPVFAGQAVIKSWIKKHWNLLKDRKVILFTTSGTHAHDPALQEGFAKSFTEDQKEKIKYFPLGGRLVFSRLKPFHRFLMNLGIKMEKDPEVKKEMAKDKDHVDKKALHPILDYVTKAL